MHKAQGLIMGGVELDAREPVTGRTALHLAVQISGEKQVLFQCNNVTDQRQSAVFYIKTHRRN